MSDSCTLFYIANAIIARLYLLELVEPSKQLARGKKKKKSHLFVTLHSSDQLKNSPITIIPVQRQKRKAAIALSILWTKEKTQTDLYIGLDPYIYK